MLAVRRYGWRVLPLLLLVALYWPGLTNWFYQDDFGWLNLRHDVHSSADLGRALFAPKAHGNIRPLGENAYFLVLSSIFGVDALPFRICAFATQMASLLLLGSIARRLTGSRAAGFWAQVLWIANAGLAAAMCWTSIYNQVLSGFFFLLAFWFWLRSIESGAARDAIGHWAAFILGLGALETNVVYPAIAAVYAAFYAPAFLKRIAPMFLVSAIYIAVHFRAAPAAATGVYALHFDGRLFDTLRTYWLWALGPSRVAAVILTFALIALVVWSMRARRWAPLFGVAWFAIVIAPYLPLSEHRMDYYLTVPVAGVALVGAAAIADARGRIFKGAVMVYVALYLAVSVPAAWRVTRWHHDRGTRVYDLVTGVAEIHQAQPGKILLLDGIDSDLFWAGIVDLPFRAMEIPHVYLTPDSAGKIQAPADLVARYVLPEELTLSALREGRAVVYRADGPVLHNVSSQYTAMAVATWHVGTPRFINLGDDLFSRYTGAGWDAPAAGYRMLSRAATVRVGGPGKDLHVGVFQTAPARLGVQVNGIAIRAEVIAYGGELTELRARLPEALAGAPELVVTLENQYRAPLKFGFVEDNR